MKTNSTLEAKKLLEKYGYIIIKASFACPYCKEKVAEVYRTNSLVQYSGMYAVKCHKCGLQGPIGGSEHEAIQNWIRLEKNLGIKQK